jgi:hypothetical protein
MPRQFNYYSSGNREYLDPWVQAAHDAGQGFQQGMGFGVEQAMLKKSKKSDLLDTIKTSGFQKKDPAKQYSPYATEIQTDDGTYVKDLASGDLSDKEMARQERQAKIDYTKAQAKALENGTPFYDFDSTTGSMKYIGNMPKGSKIAPSSLPSQKYADKLNEMEELKQKQSNMVKEAAQDTLATIGEVKKGMKYFGVTGGIPSLPGTEGATWDANVNKLLSQKIVNLMAEMKNASRTGATGFGQLNQQELKVLQDASTALKRTLREEDAAAILSDMEIKLQKIATGQEAGQPNHNEAVDWARQNPNDPRSAEILKRNGLAQ